MKEFIRSITDSLSQTSGSMENAASKLLPVSDEGYWLGDKVGIWTDYLIPDSGPFGMGPEEVSQWFADQMKDNLGLYRMERETRMIRPSGMPQQITILPTVNGDGRKRNIFDLLEEDAVDVITEAAPVYGRREILYSPDEITDQTGQNEVRQTDAVIAPFSRYTPTVLWPFSTDNGERYTVHDLGEENLDFPGKTIAEYALGRELDRVGALPGFHMWGDPLLGVAPVAIGGGTALIVGATAWMWGPAIANRAATLAKATTYGLLELGSAVFGKVKDITKSPF